MKRLDRYVVRIVIGAFLAAMTFFLFLTIVVDLLNNLSRYASRAADQQLGGVELAVYLGGYYLKLLPVLVTTVTPFAAVIAGMFTVTRLHNANEIVPMLFVGRSIHRVLRPVLWCGCVGAVLMVCSWQWVVPRFGADLTANETFLREGSSELDYLVHQSHGDSSYYLYVGAYDAEQRRMTDVRMVRQGVLADDVRWVTAVGATWDQDAGDWRLDGGRYRRPVAGEDGAARRIDGDRQQWLLRTDLTPERLLQQGREHVDPDLLSYTELVELAEARPNRADVRLALHRHVTYPLANLLLLLLALPMAVRYERGSRIDRIVAAIGLCGGYFLLDLICQRLGQRDLIHPIVAAWTPTIVFGSLGIVLWGSTRS